MREHIRNLIEKAHEAPVGIGLDESQDTALRLAEETIRLARLAASTHMILAARLDGTEPGSPVDSFQEQQA